MKWEYVASYADYAEVSRELSAYGEQGWELVSAQLNHPEARWYLMLKRPVAETIWIDSKAEQFCVLLNSLIEAHVDYGVTLHQDDYHADSAGKQSAHEIFEASKAMMLAFIQAKIE